jgi:hypothetical protein
LNFGEIGCLYSLEKEIMGFYLTLDQVKMRRCKRELTDTMTFRIIIEAIKKDGLNSKAI